MKDKRGAPPEELLPPPKNFQRSAKHQAQVAAGVVPAFIARASRLERTQRRLIEGLAAQRLELIDPVMRGVKRLGGIEGSDEQAARAFFEPQYYLAIAREVREHPEWAERWVDTTPLWRWGMIKLRRLLVERVDRFNTHWDRAIEEADLDVVNDQIARYNEYYPLEREMFRVYNSRRDFEAKEPWTRAQLAQQFPLLPTLLTT